MPLPARLVGGCPVLVAVAAAVAWRFAPPAYGFAGLTATAVATAVVAWRRPAEAWRGWWLAGAAAAVIAALRFVPGWWPCELHCAGAGRFERILGVPVLPPAIAAYALFAALCLIERRRPEPSPLLRHFAWALTGCSLFFLLLSVGLRLACPHCLAVHGAVLALLGPLLATSWRPPLRLATGMTMALTAATALLVGVLISAPPDDHDRPATGLSGGDQAVVAFADLGRKQGDEQAPLLLELLIDFQCPRCAAAHDAVLTAVAPLIAAHRLQLVTRHAVRPGDVSSRLLAEWAFAAAANGANDYALFTSGMLGSRQGADIKELRTRLAEVLDPAPLEARIAAHHAAFAQLIIDDGRRISDLGGGLATPQAFVVERAGGAVRGHWTGTIPVDEVVKAAER